MNATVELHPTAPVLIMTRALEAPRELVWATLTDPKHVAQWYGGHGFSNPLCEMDVRPGGVWKHVMRAPDGSEFSLQFVFLEVVKPQRLSWRNAGPDAGKGGPHDNTIVVTLEAAERITKWRMEAHFRTLEDRAAAMKMGFATVLGEGTDKVVALLREAK